MMKVAQDIDAKDEKDKNFLLRIIKAFVYPVMFCIIFAFVILGGKVSPIEAIGIAKDKLE